MDFQLSDDQRALVDALQSILQDFAELPQDERLGYAYHNPVLQQILADNGFFDAASTMGPLEAALVTFETAKSLISIETFGNGLVWPMLGLTQAPAGPVALVAERDLAKGIRNLTIARQLLVDCGDDVIVLDLASAAVVSVPSIFAYPYGRFAEIPDLAAGRRLPGKGQLMRQWWRVGLAAEIFGAADAAIAFTIDYVKQRHVLGRPVGSFQAVRHRLVQRYGYARSGYFLTMRAAWSGLAIDADIAATRAISGINDLLFDLHQFNGGMGVTTEYSLHFWTYRIRALQAEAGGLTAAALDIADRRWSSSVVTAKLEQVD
ncbi:MULTISPECIES: acyl-CoA dehydrogenase family protein [unclassified Novosphingobium]|uniref:acyl-CoA dehydrogenase family protein n=1 Tax=unclassified Novosphingobium TaxID=2644732 RepID=UPI000D2F6EFC|nr:MULTISPECIES: acyl-CoA dehydrogenase family protein [unclassified Novosphingobium]PTR12552.1 acyl-CoA dehydrogenase-like protein [Novosphingobium sp. GV055]PUB06336.1 acyl-CoA dehydrogenase-like protein [Novosphingobium sp. GV061]PUB22387.1 acyl-CoA dehydrogenase-like protein [Novosphingobium sp. GV079]PUB44412.1 acyl-CoA dehydrogenase-like protein [Novosphingobium sp. GV027]